MTRNHGSSAHGHHEESSPGVVVPQGWPTGPGGEDGEPSARAVGGYLARALGDTDSADLYELLRRMKKPQLQYMMSALNMRSVARVNQGMAAALLGHLRNRNTGHLLDNMFQPLRGLFDHAYLDAGQWSDLLSADWERTVSGWKRGASCACGPRGVSQ